MRISFPLALFSLFLTLVGILVGPALAEESRGQEEVKGLPRTERFVLVVIDGLANSYLDPAITPTISGLGAAGVRVEQVSGVLPQTLEAALASLLTGVTPARHGVYGPKDSSRAATLFSLLAKREAAVALFVVGSRNAVGLGEGIPKVIRAADDARLIDLVIEYLREEKPYFVTIVLTGPGTALRRGGDKKAYREAVAAVDAQIGRLCGYLYEEEAFATTFFCITGTTGEPPLILKAPELKEGSLLPPAAIIDVAPTLAHFMGVKLPQREGLVLWNAFAPTSGQSETYLLELRIKDLSEALFTSQREIWRFMKERAAVEQEKEKIARLQREMSERLNTHEKSILQLSRTIAWLKAMIVLLLGLSGLGYIFEYRFLRRRFLLFK